MSKGFKHTLSIIALVITFPMMVMGFLIFLLGALGSSYEDKIGSLVGMVSFPLSFIFYRKYLKTGNNFYFYKQIAVSLIAFLIIFVFLFRG